jgi:hypothetical protein
MPAQLKHKWNINHYIISVHNFYMFSLVFWHICKKYVQLIRKSVHLADNNNYYNLFGLWEPAYDPCATFQPPTNHANSVLTALHPSSTTQQWWELVEHISHQPLYLYNKHHDYRGTKLCMLWLSVYTEGPITTKTMLKFKSLLCYIQ